MCTSGLRPREAQEYDVRENLQLDKTSGNKSKQWRTNSEGFSDAMLIIYNNNLT